MNLECYTIRRLSPVVFNASPVLYEEEDIACVLFIGPALAEGPRKHPWLISTRGGLNKKDSNTVLSMVNVFYTFLLSF